MAKAADRTQMLRLYRHIIRNAKAFPSIKRDAIVQDIRIEFREGATETNPVKLQQRISVAVKGLEQLRAYTGLDKNSEEWVIDLEQAPLGNGTNT